MTRVLIIDDEPLSRALIREYLQDIDDIQIVGECGDGFEGLRLVNLLQPELIFLDVQMPRINGFELLELLVNPPAIIFVTAYDSYALKAFELHAVDYLLKPFSKGRFNQALLQFQSRRLGALAEPVLATLLGTAASLPGQRDRIVVRSAGTIQVIPVSAVNYLEADDDMVIIHTAKDAYPKNQTLNYFEQLLEPSQFLRVHRSYILRIQDITRIDPYHKDSFLAQLRSGAQIPVSKKGYSRLKDVLGI